ncbi:cation:proton antiporter [Mycetocola saprophilus]|uniref:cation:proton antiporter domain-containing protein n=1 Tax=Mycetocola saprophilus TaxID=76636 RepID=UPI0005BB7F5E|nr:cation:proton antiporter [Mycetocola saprophilus]
MPPLVLIGLAAVALWSLVSHRFERWGIAGPAALIALGALTTGWNVTAFAEAIDTQVSANVVELILAILLFTDAMEVRGRGLFGGERNATLRLLLIALPLSILLAAVVSVFLIPDALLVALVIACIVMPIDLAPAARMLKLGSLPPRVRSILTIEGGYNDGLVAPFFGMSLAMAVAITKAIDAQPGDQNRILDQGIEDFARVFVNAAPSILAAIAVGIALGTGLGLAVRRLHRAGWASDAGIRLVTMLLPLIAFGITTSIPEINANGFVAAFVTGLAYRIMRTRGMEVRSIPHTELRFIDEVGVLTTNFVWFMLGGTMLVAFSGGVDWRLIVFAVLALTVLRIGPVYLSLLRSTVPRRDRLLIGALGPRGTASIVFTLIAYNALPSGSMEADFVLVVAVATVVGSVIIHGVIAPALLDGWGRRRGSVSG